MYEENVCDRLLVLTIDIINRLHAWKIPGLLEEHRQIMYDINRVII